MSSPSPHTRPVFCCLFIHPFVLSAFFSSDLCVFFLSALPCCHANPCILPPLLRFHVAGGAGEGRWLQTDAPSCQFGPLRRLMTGGGSICCCSLHLSERGEFPHTLSGRGSYRCNAQTNTTAERRFSRMRHLFESPIRENSTEQNCDGIRMNDRCAVESAARVHF